MAVAFIQASLLALISCQPAAARRSAQPAGSRADIGAGRDVRISDARDLRADRPADQLCQHHRLSLAVRHRRRVSYLFRDGLARRRRDRFSSVQPGSRHLLFGARLRHRLRRSLWLSSHPGTLPAHGADPDDRARLDFGLRADLPAGLLGPPRARSREAIQPTSNRSNGRWRRAWRSAGPGRPLRPPPRPRPHRRVAPRAG